ncbi:MAG: leucine-rich repeat domain-containing protein [Muribaculaceae bacterium]|nr:leucine-rich repeat domain-containing protein [Muribaculaceae bacterium]
MKKRLLLALVGAFSLVLPMNAGDIFVYNFNGQPLKYEVLSEQEKTCRVAPALSVGDIPHQVRGNLIIPEVAVRNSNKAEYRVVEIGERSFFVNQITSVEIPASIVKIGKSAFMGTLLESITLPESVVEIAASAFSQCFNLASINLSESIVSIGDGAFEHCYSLRSIQLPPSLKSLGADAFADCLGLTQIDLPESLTSIGYGAFFQSGLRSIIIPDSITSLRSTFAFCEDLESVTLPSTLTSIGSSTFLYCSKLQSVVIPDEVTSIGEQAFEECTSLRSVNIPSRVTSIERQTFSNCSALEKIDIPDGIESIGQQAFERCSNLKVIKLPDALTSLGNGAFSYCSSLTSASLPKSLTAIGWLAFYGTKLSSVIIPEAVKTIGHDAFSKCPNLKFVYYEAREPQAFDSNIFDATTLSNATLSVVKDAADACGELTPWNQFKLVTTFDPIEAAEYKPLLENGKSWTIGRTMRWGSYREHNARMPRYQMVNTYEVAGDTIVEGLACKVIAIRNSLNESLPKYILHEEAGVISLYHESYYKKPFVKLLDFNVVVGNDLKVNPIDVMEQVWDYDKVYCTPTNEKFAKGVDEVTRNEIVFNGSSWVEGIGASHDNWLVYNAVFPTTIDLALGRYMIDCRKDGEIIFSNKNFACGSNEGLLGAKTVTPGKSWTMARGAELLTFSVDRDTLVSGVLCRVITCSDGKEYIVTEENGIVYGFSDRFGNANPDYNAFPISGEGEVQDVIFRVDGEKCAYMNTEYWKISDIKNLNVGHRSFNEYLITADSSSDEVIASWVEGVGAPDARSWATQMPEGYDLRMIDCRQDGEVIFTAEDFTHQSGIREVSADSAKRAGAYDLQGRRVDHPTRGLYIINGKKTLLK